MVPGFGSSRVSSDFDLGTFGGDIWEKPWIIPGDFHEVMFWLWLVFLSGGYNVLPEKELHRSLQVEESPGWVVHLIPPPLFRFAPVWVISTHEMRHIGRIFGPTTLNAIHRCLGIRARTWGLSVDDWAVYGRWQALRRRSSRLLLLEDEAGSFISGWVFCVILRRHSTFVYISWNCYPLHSALCELP